jgi:hypothetical protein
MARVFVLSLVLLVGVYAALAAQAPLTPPRIWDDAALADWATPIAALNVRPAHYSAARYYAVPGDNLRTYPVYHPDSEPPGYWQELQKKKPEPLVDVSTIRTREDWIAAGERAFFEGDSFWVRSSDPALIAQARDVRSFAGVRTEPDGTLSGPRWVVTPDGVMLSFKECGNCHAGLRRGPAAIGWPAGTGPAPRGLELGRAPALDSRFLQGSQRFFTDDPLGTMLWRMFNVPWASDERVNAFREMTSQQVLQQPLKLAPIFVGSDLAGGTFNRIHGSPFAPTKIPDLRILRYSRYLDATATHRLRGPEDVARYAAFVTGADPMDFGPHRILTNAQRRVRFRYADEVLYAIGMFLWSLEPPRNPDPLSPELVTRGEQIFRRESCVNCHVPPNYTSGKLTLAQGWQLPSDHPNRDDVIPLSVGTDPALALKTRKGTGFYKIPSLRGLWYRQRLLHDGSLTSLEEMFNPARVTPDYEPKGANPPGITKRAVPGHTFGLSLDADDKRALLAFLRSL